MREIPGYYYDAERNRYFKISNRPLPSTFVTGPSSTNTNTNANTTNTPVNYSYDKETIKRMKLEQVQLNKKKKLSKQIRQSQYLHLPGFSLKQQLIETKSGLETFIRARSHLPPNLIKSSYSVRFIKPYLGEKLTRSGGFQLNQSLYHSHVKGGRLMLGSKQGNLKVLDLESPVSNINSNSNCITGFKELINQNVADNDIKEVKVLSRNFYSYVTLGTGLESGKVVILKNSNTGVSENWKFKSKSSLFCFEASQDTLVAGGEHSIWLLRDWQHTGTKTMTKLVSPSDVLSVCLDSKQGTMFHAGCRNGGVLTYDTRCRNLNPSKSDTVSSKPIYKILKPSENYLLGAGLDGFVFQLDLRFKKTVVQSFPGLSNSYDSSLGFTFSHSLNTLFAAGDDNTIKMWSLDSGLGITPPFKKYNHPIQHLHFIEIPSHRNPEIVSHSTPSPLLPKGCLLLGNEVDWECWSL